MKRQYIVLPLFIFTLYILSRTPLCVAMTGVTDKGFIGAETCKECHEDHFASYANSIHSRHAVKGPASEDACETCHGPGAMHVEKGGGRGVDIFAFNEKSDPKEKSAKCLSCHSKRSDMMAWDHGTHNMNDVSCDSCHDLHSMKSQLPDEPEVCFGCHATVRMDVNKRSHHPIREGKVNCSSCHNPHGSISAHLIKEDDAQELCYSCHSDKRGPYIFEHPPVAENCLTCHQPHGSRHSKLLTQKAPNLCQDCHVWERHPGTVYDNNSSFSGRSPSNRFFGRSCLNCHGAIHGSNSFENHRLTR